MKMEMRGIHDPWGEGGRERKEGDIGNLVCTVPTYIPASRSLVLPVSLGSGVTVVVVVSML